MSVAKVLKITLHGELVGHLVGFQDGLNILQFAEIFKINSHRPTFSLTTMPDFPGVDKKLQNPWKSRQKLHPILSNLLPEGALRELIAAGLKVHIDNEFEMLAYLGKDLPGALIVEPVLYREEIPSELIIKYGEFEDLTFDKQMENKFSLAGVQMKFSMKEQDGRYILGTNDELGDWIIKTPSTKHIDVPANEYTAMTLASLVGIKIPEIKLVGLNTLDNLPPISLPNEQFAYAIKRFDRDGNHRIHMEDFAQILVKYYHEKYYAANYQQIGKIIYEYSSNKMDDIQGFAKRLLVNILLANGDAHLKNWSFIYPDKYNPRLSFAYDIVSTAVYFDHEDGCALNLGKIKKWYLINLETFEYWANKVGVPWNLIKPHLIETINQAREVWPKALQALPMNEEHKVKLIKHWTNLHPDFSIN
ncbi:type II toxin-antitoxin system HipA family toxin [Thiotrichales bacterium 19S11-10]|nr:type II toxin-antitoxin system HipA family toxin [Thiotrichales bacterium 19S11-10]